MKNVELSIEDIQQVTKALNDRRRMCLRSDFPKADRLYRMFQRAENVRLELSQATMSAEGNLGEGRPGGGAAR